MIAPSSPDYAALLTRALQTIDRLKADRASGRSKREPIAIVGMSARLPGAENGLDSFWQLMLSGVDAVGDIPADRWNIADYCSNIRDEVAAIASPRGGFIGDLKLFDADFFGIAPREARSLDPQQRLLLELAWHALEDAAIPPSTLAGGMGGVFVGISSSDYQQMLASRDEGAIDAYMTSGTTHSTAAGRVSFTLDLHGPAMSIDTACSSSLVALHTACRALTNGECSMALVGGVNRIITPTAHINFTRAGMLSPNGRCATFDDAADGYVRAEGGAMLVCKRLSDARRDGDRIFAVVAGSAVNHDGRSSGLTVPNGPAQESVVRAAMADAGIVPNTVDYVEAHGTGTALGDPIEVASLAKIFAGRDGQVPLGSIKAQIGHLEAAAGAAGLVKVVLALRHAVWPGQCDFVSPSRKIAWDGMPLKVAETTEPWRSRDGVRTAGISSFGFSGTNAHAILASVPASDAVADDAAPIDDAIQFDRGSDMMILPISARHPVALDTLVRDHAVRIAALPPEHVASYCRTAATGRDTLGYRIAVAGNTTDDLIAGLGDAISAGPRSLTPAPRVAFMFAGQGTLRPGMGQSLAAGEPSFREALARADAVLSPQLGASITEFMWGERTHQLVETQFAQPILTAFHMALAETWRNWGVVADGVCGHSVGEIAAAYYAGALGWEDALTLSVRRGAIMARSDGSGAMLAVIAPAADVRRLAATYDVEVAAENGNANTVVSGDTSSIERFAEAVGGEGIAVQRLSCDRAFHSRHLDSVMPELASMLGAIEVRKPGAALFASTATGHLETVALSDPSYWQGQARRTVLFADARATLAANGFDMFLEIGPGTALTGIVRAERSGTGVLATCPGSGSTSDFRRSVAALFEAGVDIDWRRRFGHTAADVTLPSYPFQRQEHWAAEKTVSSVRVKQPAPTERFAYTPTWVPAPLIDAPAGPVTATILNEAISDGRTLLSNAELGAKLDRYSAHEEQLEELAGRFVTNAMTALGGIFEVGDRFTEAALAERLGIVPAHRRLFARMIEILSEQGIVVADTGGWRVTKPLAPDTLVSDGSSLAGVEFRLLDRCGSSLAAVLVGIADPVELLFPRGDSSDVQELYRDGPVLDALNRTLASAVATIVAAQPAGRLLRILEIGAGTGGSTRAILSALPDERVEYWFTDVSPMFLARAKDEWRDRSDMVFRTLDAERPLDEQDIPHAAFDIVIASNVLHATRDLADATSHAAAALKPGGALLLIEGVERQRWVDLTFGLTDGWWRFTDVARRPDYALLSAEGWASMLSEIGLVDICAIEPMAGAAQNVIMARTPLVEGVSGRQWLLLDNDAAGGPVAAISASLVAAGERVTTVRRGGPFTLSGASCSLDALRKEDWTRLLSTVGSSPLIVHGWSCDVDAGDMPIETGEELCVGLITLAQAVEATCPQATLRILTPVDTQAPGYAAGGALAAAAQCIGFDLAEVDVRSIAIGPEVSGTELIDECLAAGESRTRLQHGRAVARLASWPSLPTPHAVMRPDGAYLITGGLGGAGLETAAWLADRGAKTLVLAGRTDTPTPDQQPLIDALRERGVRVELRSVDIGDARETFALIASFGDNLPTLHGVFHAAGVIDPITPVSALDEVSVLAMLRPKLRGGELLDAATRGLPLDCFVLFSSGASVWGFRGESHYAAANGYLDALGARRRATGLPGSVVNWGFLSFGGMTSGDGNRSMLRELGVNAVERDGFRDALDIAVASGTGQLVYADNDWARLAELFAVRGADAFFDGLPGVGNGTVAVDRTKSSSVPDAKASGRVNLKGVSGKRLVERIEDALFDELRDVLGGRGADAADTRDRGFLAFGMDSLMAVDFKHRLERLFGVPLPATLIFDHPTPLQLAQHLGRVIEASVSSHDLNVTGGHPVLTTSAAAPTGEDLRRQLESLLED